MSNQKNIVMDCFDSIYASLDAISRHIQDNDIPSDLMDELVAFDFTLNNIKSNLSINSSVPSLAGMEFVSIDELELDSDFDDIELIEDIQELKF